MVTSVLFGEIFKVHESLEAWHRVTLEADGYEGWIENASLAILEASACQVLRQQKPFYAVDSIVRIENKSRRFPIYFGSTIYRSAKGCCTAGDEEFAFEGKVHLPETLDVSLILEMATRFLETPYLWGGRTTFGTDCSGMVQTLFRIAGYSLPRDASLQAKQGNAVDWHDRQPGDLAFFSSANGRITHVGILAANDGLIHATSVGGSKVRNDKLSEHGIINAETGIITHPLAFIRRMI